MGAGIAAGLAVHVGGGASTAQHEPTPRGFHSHQYTVSIDGHHQRFSVDVPKQSYAEARAKPRSFARAAQRARASDLLHRLGREIADQYDSNSERVTAAQALVTSIPYASDDASTGRENHIRYPTETLAEHTGDCEDLALVLMGVLASPALGFRTGLILPRGHCAVLVARGDLPSSMLSPDPLTLTLSSTEYVYLESVARRLPGRWARDYGERSLFAAYRHRWHPLNTAALGEEALELMKNGKADATWQFVS